MGSNVSETKVVWAGGALAMIVEVVVLIFWWWWLGSAGGDGAVVDTPKGEGVGCCSVVLIFLDTGCAAFSRHRLLVVGCIGYLLIWGLQCGGGPGWNHQNFQKFQK